MKKFIKAVDRIGAVCEKFTIALSILLMAAMLVAITLGVFVRLFLNGGFVWTDEFSRWCLVDAAFIGASVLIRRKGGLVSLDILVDRFHGKARYLADVIIEILCLAFIIVFLVQGAGSIPTYLTYKALTIPTNQAVPLIGMEFGGVLMAVFMLEKLIKSIFQISGGNLEEVLVENGKGGAEK